MGLHSFLVFSSGNGLKCWAALQTDPGQDREETLSKDKEGKYKTANFFMKIFKVTTGDVLGPLINITQGYHLIKQDSKRPSEEVRQHNLEIIKSLAHWSKCSIFLRFQKFSSFS